MRLSGSTPTTTCTMRHLGRLRIVLQLDERVGHGGEAEGAQTFDGGMNGHDDILINCSNHGRGCWDGEEGWGLNPRRRVVLGRGPRVILKVRAMLRVRFIPGARGNTS